MVINSPLFFTAPPSGGSRKDALWGPFYKDTNPISSHTVHVVLKARMLRWFAIPFSSGSHFVRTLHRDPSTRVTLHGMAYSFIELDKAVIPVNSHFTFTFASLSFSWGKIPGPW